MQTFETAFLNVIFVIFLNLLLLWKLALYTSYVCVLHFQTKSPMRVGQRGMFVLLTLLSLSTQIQQNIDLLHHYCRSALTPPTTAPACTLHPHRLFCGSVGRRRLNAGHS